jgi:hypothetical protein
MILGKRVELYTIGKTCSQGIRGWRAKWKLIIAAVEIEELIVAAGKIGF